MGTQNLADDRQPQAATAKGSGPAGVQFGEALEDSIALLGGNPDAVVFDHKMNSVGLGLQVVE